jgi:hypothetical protein
MTPKNTLTTDDGKTSFALLRAVGGILKVTVYHFCKKCKFGLVAQRKSRVLIKLRSGYHHSPRPLSKV